ncbi:MAG: RimK family alpha-L-glutamate ligase [Desulfatibacillaceae bacterium]
MRFVALEARLRDCANVRTLGVHPNFTDYSPEDRELMTTAGKIYYPSEFYCQMFTCLGKPTFPGPSYYHFAQNKIRQTALFELAGIPHPRTRVYYGETQQEAILRDFALPFVAKEPRGSARGEGVFRIESRAGLDAYLEDRHVAYIQELVPTDRDVRVVVIGGEARFAYWRIAPKDGFCSNVSRGGRIGLDKVPRSAVRLAVETARRCRFDDCGMDVILSDGTPLVLEANMKYGREGFREAGIDYTHLMENLLADGQI